VNAEHLPKNDLVIDIADSDVEEWDRDIGVFIEYLKLFIKSVKGEVVWPDGIKVTQTDRSLKFAGVLNKPG
jgi:hypothetical protein